MRSSEAVKGKRVIYVGGLGEDVNENTLRSAMVPFGEIVDVQIPIDYVSERHRGFGFVEFETAEEAAAAIDNMNGSEIFGRTLKVNIARSMFNQQNPEHAKRAVWADDEWIQKYVVDDDDDDDGDDDKEKIVEENNEAVPDRSLEIKSTNPRTFLEIQIDGRVMGKLIIELYANIVPKTCENFRRLCVGEIECSAGSGSTKSSELTYKNCSFHRIINKFMCQSGDITKKDGTGGRSVYGAKFDDENFALKHDKAGMVSMANSGPNSNNSQFFIIFEACDWLDGRHVVFGRVTESGIAILKKIETCGTKTGAPKKNVIISNCGEIENVS